ncbi:MAG: regulatory protein RecX [Propionibacteriaceae bacterium]
MSRIDPDADPVEVARHIALVALTGQSRTRQELADLLARKQVPAAAIDEVLARFTDVGLIDDNAFAQAWVSSRQQRRHLSSKALRVELSRKGIAKEDIEQAVSEISWEDEYQAALALGRNRISRMQGLDRQTQYRRLAGLLGRRGFSGGIINDVLREIIKIDAEE